MYVYIYIYILDLTEDRRASVSKTAIREALWEVAVGSLIVILLSDDKQ